VNCTKLRLWMVLIDGRKSGILLYQELKVQPSHFLFLILGRIMGSNFERLNAFDNVQVRDFQYQLAIYIFEKGLGSGNFSRATAVGLFQSLVGLLLVIAADRFAKVIGEDGLL
jgi:putative aldouronate transport system permease protein